MIYLDYSATTKVNSKVLNRFNEVTEKFYANPNSHYDIASNSSNLISNNTQIIKDYFNVKDYEVIYTSGASEANNMLIKGLADIRKERHIITTKLEHSSIITPLGYLQKKGYKISFVDLNEDGTVNFESLKSLMTEDTLLVTIACVSSELGIKQPINEIGKMVKEINQSTIMHTDMTQAVGKTDINLEYIDAASFSGHKIYTFKGIGALILKNDLKITPLIHGGKSTTSLRSGTPQTELIDSLGTAVTLLNNNFDYVNNLNNMIREHISKYENIKLNSTNISVPHILNFSILGKDSDEIQKYFAENKIYLSTKTACSSESNSSLAVLTLTSDDARATSSIRISLSSITTTSEVEEFLIVLDKYMEDK